MKETVASIALWADETFGPTTPMRALVRTLEEASELATHLMKGETLEAAQEAADVFLVMCRYYQQVYHSGRIASVLTSDIFLAEAPPIESAAVLIKTLGTAMLEESVFGRSHSNVSLAVITIVRRLLLDLHVDFEELVDAKMDINRKREWKRDGTGCGQHVEAASA